MEIEIFITYNCNVAKITSKLSKLSKNLYDKNSALSKDHYRNFSSMAKEGTKYVTEKTLSV